MVTPISSFTSPVSKVSEVAEVSGRSTTSALGICNLGDWVGSMDWFVGEKLQESTIFHGKIYGFL
jgi:hypothetical protein